MAYESRWGVVTTPTPPQHPTYKPHHYQTPYRALPRHTIGGERSIGRAEDYPRRPSASPAAPVPSASDGDGAAPDAPSASDDDGGGGDDDDDDDDGAAPNTTGVLVSAGLGAFALAALASCVGVLCYQRTRHGGGGGGAASSKQGGGGAGGGERGGGSRGFEAVAADDDDDGGMELVEPPPGV